MKIYDISLPIHTAMVVWPGDPPVILNKLSEIEKGDPSNITQIRMSVHTGTHIDAPRHFIHDGDTVDQIPLTTLVGEVLVMEIDAAETVISAQILKSHPDRKLLEKATRVLFRTNNSMSEILFQKSFNQHYVGIDTSGAKYLASLNLSLIGVDYLSVATYEETVVPHQVLLSQKIVLLEGINLSQISAGSYQLVCLPLNIIGCEGSPARVILIDA